MLCADVVGVRKPGGMLCPNVVGARKPAGMLCADVAQGPGRPLFVLGPPGGVLAAELFGPYEEHRRGDSQALREREQPFEVHVELPLFQGRDARGGNARCGGEIVGAEAAPLADLAHRSAEEDEILGGRQVSAEL